MSKIDMKYFFQEAEPDTEPVEEAEKEETESVEEATETTEEV